MFFCISKVWGLSNQSCTVKSCDRFSGQLSPPEAPCDLSDSCGLSAILIVMFMCADASFLIKTTLPSIPMPSMKASIPYGITRERPLAEPVGDITSLGWAFLHSTCSHATHTSLLLVSTEHAGTRVFHKSGCWPFCCWSRGSGFRRLFPPHPHSQTSQSRTLERTRHVYE